MFKLDDELHERKAFLKKIEKKIKRFLKQAPPGKLRTNSSNGTVQYRIIYEGSTTPTYISKSKLKPARVIAQRDYYLKALKIIAAELEAIENLILTRAISKIEELYNNTKKPRRMLIAPLTLTDEEYARQWERRTYYHKSNTNSYKFETIKGETVRSKSEVIIANILFLLGIPYKYECPLILPNGRTIYVDFLILDVKNRKEIWYEHFGMMGIVWYADDNTERFNYIVSAGLIPGDNFIATFETENKVLDTETILKIFEPYRTNDDYIDLKKIAEEAESFD